MNNIIYTVLLPTLTWICYNQIKMRARIKGLEDSLFEIRPAVMQLQRIAMGDSLETNDADPILYPDHWGPSRDHKYEAIYNYDDKQVIIHRDN